jgi:hypothetical protein
MLDDGRPYKPLYELTPSALAIASQIMPSHMPRVWLAGAGRRAVGSKGCEATATAAKFNKKASAVVVYPNLLAFKPGARRTHTTRTEDAYREARGRR